MNRKAWMIVVIGLAACSQPSEEDRRQVIGLWAPDDGSGMTIEFKPDGVFDFVYDPGPIKTTLRIGWKLRSRSKVDMLQHDGSVYKTCSYKVEGAKLSIDDGSGKECLRSATTPASLMPTSFTRKG